MDRKNAVRGVRDGEVVKSEVEGSGVLSTGLQAAVPTSSEIKRMKG